MKRRPQFKGLPIPYIAYIGPDGKPDFRVTDEAKRVAVLKHGLCQLCGDSLGKYFFFVGGTEAAKHNQYFEPACHLDCLIYAMQVCPFIAGKMEHAPIKRVDRAHEGEDVIIKADETFSSVRNPYWVIKKAVGWDYARTPGGTVLIIPTAIKETPPMHAETMTGADWQKVFDYLVAPPGAFNAHVGRCDERLH